MCAVLGHSQGSRAGRLRSTQTPPRDGVALQPLRLPNSCTLPRQLLPQRWLKAKSVVCIPQLPALWQNSWLGLLDCVSQKQLIPAEQSEGRLFQAGLGTFFSFAGYHAEKAEEQLPSLCYSTHYPNPCFVVPGVGEEPGCSILPSSVDFPEGMTGALCGETTAPGWEKGHQVASNGLWPVQGAYSLEHPTMLCGIKQAPVRREGRNHLLRGMWYPGLSAAAVFSKSQKT